ncbi:MAG: hypothetical protein AABN95_08355 [Acidobacteriota bacterium]
MTVEKKLRLPFSDPYKVDIQIRIQPATEGFDAYVKSDYSSEHPLVINITKDDVRDLNDELHTALEQVRVSFDSSRFGLGIGCLPIRKSLLTGQLRLGAIYRP